MRVIVRLAEQRKVGSTEVADSPFDPILFDGDLDIDDIRLAQREGRPIPIAGQQYIVKDLRINSVSGETVAEIEVEPRTIAARGG